MTNVYFEESELFDGTDDYIHDMKSFAIGCLVGQAVGDALGGPFEFGQASEYARSFPRPVLGGKGEMIGGGAFGWKPAEFTDDTQMALCLAESVIANNLSYNPSDVFERFVHWAKTAKDVGSTTAATLFSGHNFADAASIAHVKRGYSGGNGCVMRVSPIGIWGTRKTPEETFVTAFNQARLTHFDERGAISAGLAAVMMRAAILGAAVEPDQLADIAIAHCPPEHKNFANLVLFEYGPNGKVFSGESNGSAWVCLAQAMWSLRENFFSSSDPNGFANAVEQAINLGGDTDTVAAVTGALAGALYGIQGIPSRWTTYLNGVVDSPFSKSGKRGSFKLDYSYSDLSDVARKLIGFPEAPMTSMDKAAGPKIVDQVGVYASNLGGAVSSKSDFAVLSLCRTFKKLDHVPVRRELYLIDNTYDNPDIASVVNDCVLTIDEWLKEGRKVLVHCHAGRSRTGFILKAWYMNRYEASHAEAHEWLASQWSLYDPEGNSLFTSFLDSY